MDRSKKEEVDKGCLMIRMGVSGWVFLLVPAYPGSPGQRAIKRFCVFVCVCETVSKFIGLEISISHEISR